MKKLFGSIVPTVLAATLIMFAPIAGADPSSGQDDGISSDTTISAPITPTSAPSTPPVSTKLPTPLAGIEKYMVHLDAVIKGYVTYINEEGKVLTTKKPIKVTIEKMCSGTLVGSGIILTAAHCTDEEGNITTIADEFVFRYPHQDLSEDKFNEMIDEMTDEELMEMQDGFKPEVISVSGTSAIDGHMIPGSAPDIKLTVWQGHYLGDEPGDKPLYDGPVDATVRAELPFDRGDVSVLQIPVETPFLPIAEQDPAFDTTVYAIGYPAVVDYGIAEDSPLQRITVSKGMMGFPQPYDGEKPGNHTDATVDYGQSGGGLFVVTWDEELGDFKVVLAGVLSNMIADKFYYTSTTSQIHQVLTMANVRFTTSPVDKGTMVIPTVVENTAVEKSDPELDPNAAAAINWLSRNYGVVLVILIVVGVTAMVLRWLSHIKDGQSATTPDSDPELDESPEPEVDQLNNRNGKDVPALQS